MANPKATKIPQTALQLLQYRTNFNSKFFNSYQFAKKCAHENIEKTQTVYDKRLHVLEDEHIAKVKKLAGEPDIVQDPALLKDVHTIWMGDTPQISGLEPHEALALARNPGHLDRELSRTDWVRIAEEGLKADIKLPTTADIEAAEWELASLEDLLDQIKHTKWNGKLHKYAPDSLEGVEHLLVRGGNGKVVNNPTNQGFSQDGIRDHMKNNYGAKKSKPMSPRKAQELMESRTRNLSDTPKSTVEFTPEQARQHQTGTYGVTFPEDVEYVETK